MKKLFPQITSILFLLILNSCYQKIPINPTGIGDTSIIMFDGNQVFFDDEKKTALVSIREYGEFCPIVLYNDINAIKFEGKTVLNNSQLNIGTVSKNTYHKIRVIYENGDSIDFDLQYTLLPIVSIEHFEKEIVDEPKILAKFTLSDPEKCCTNNEFCGIELRGASAQSTPKHSYGFKLYSDYEGNSNKSISLLNIRKNDNWILDGIYSDKSCARNRVSFDLWNQIQRDSHQRGRNILFSSVEGKYVELFINNKYQGAYAISQKVDAVTLGFSDSIFGGYIYKCENWNQTSKFLETSDTIDSELTWKGWEQKYPTNTPTCIWKPLYNLTNFVVESSDKIFCENVSEYIEIDQFIDFVILVNMIKGYDNVGQNLILASLAGKNSFYFCPWDMDATWGRDWDSSLKDEKGIVLFKIYDRFLETNPDNFKQRLTQRWNELRNEILTSKNINQLYNNYYLRLNSSSAAKREQEIWTDSYPDPEWEKQYIEDWVEKRLTVLDEYFYSLTNN